MRFVIPLPLALLLAGTLSNFAHGQSLPADTGASAAGVGFSLPTIGGNVSYALSASELVSSGFYNSGASFTTSLSGDLAYVTKSPRHPFSAVYAGGVLLANSGQPTTTFQSLAFSQVLSTRNWNITLSDSVNYLPASPVGGLSGVPGVGDLGVDPISTETTAGLGILTTYEPRVSNNTAGTVARQITKHISAQGTGLFVIQHFLGDNSGLGINSQEAGGSVGLSYHFSARDSITGNYNYTNFSFSSGNFGATSQGATVEYSRQWSRRLLTDVYAGPQIISGSNTLINGSSTQLAAGASVSYLSRSTTYSLSYSRGVNNGSGVIPGAFSDNLTGTAHRKIGREWTVAGNLGFSRTTSLPNLQIATFNSKAVTVGAQGSRAFGRSFSGFLEYTIEDQSVSATSKGLVAGNAFNGFYQIFGFGITYAPRNLRLGR